MAWIVHNSFSLDDRHIPEKSGQKIPPEWSRAVRFQERVDIGDAAIRAKLMYPRSYIPDFMSWGGLSIVCDTFRRIVEKLEPHMHQFAPAILHDEQDRPIEQILWGMNVLQFCEAVIVEKSQIKVTPVPEERQTALKHTRWLGGAIKPYSLTLSKEAIGGRHLWRSREMHGYYFLSEELMARVMDQRLRPIVDFEPTKEE